MVERRAFSCEGIPRADLLIWDVRWQSPKELAEILARHPPEFLLLVDEARFIAPLPEYSWTFGDHYTLGALLRPRT